MANFSRERRRHVRDVLRRSGILASDLTDTEQLMYAVGCLICDDAGRFTHADLRTALVDPSIVQAARTLLRKAGQH